MAKNRLFPQKQSLDPAVSHTIGAVVSPFSQADDDDDNDICPVCDGECTCDIKPRAVPPTPLAMSALGTSSTSDLNLASTPKPARPTLKIKLTVPQSLLGKRRAPPSSSYKSKSPAETTFASEFDGNPSFPLEDPPTQLRSSQSLPITQPKRRGRPPKAVVAARALAVRLAAESHKDDRFSSTFQPAKRTKQPNPRYLPTSKKSAAATKRRRVASARSSDKSDVDHRSNNDSDDDDAHSGRFPTFISASALSSQASSSSESDDSSLSGFDSDSSIEAEEEDFILSEMQSRARVRRDFICDDVPMRNHNTWIIRPRKNSVGPDDSAMAVDTDATEDEDEEEDEECEDEAEETDGMAPGGYVGMATGWSDDDDESSFDADLFFANLSDSENSNGSSTVDDDAGDDGDQSDLESTTFGEASIPTLLPRPNHHGFEVTEGWDGQIVFTNGLSEGQGILDMDFEATAAQFTVETSASPSQESDAELSTSDINDRGYEEDVDGGMGDTTDEELVGDDDLPNERAMKLFSLPSSVSAINPLSTMSPTVSPGPRNRKPFNSRSLDSPKPADILSGKFFWDSDDQDECDGSTTKSRGHSSSNGGPRTGQFEPLNDTRRAIIDGSRNEIPSPHPRFRRRAARCGNLEHMLRKHVLTAKQSSRPASDRSLLQILSTVEKSTPMSPSTEIVDLDEVLEASFLDAEASDSQTAPIEEADSHKQQLIGVNRWDVISVGAFRQTQDTGTVTDGTTEWSSDAPASTPATDYGKMMKSSPLSTMLWQNKGIKQKRSRKMNIVISPVILPVRDREGDQASGVPPNHAPPHKQNHHPYKSRKELRRERKLKRKSYSTLPHQHHQRHFHQHHPNSKTRSTSSTQRMNSSSFSIPPLSL